MLLLDLVIEVYLLYSDMSPALVLQQTEVDKLRSELERKEMELVRASQASTFSDLSDTDGIPAASESFTEKVGLYLTW